MNIRLPSELKHWLDSIRKQKSRQSMIIDVLYKNKEKRESDTKNKE